MIYVFLIFLQVFYTVYANSNALPDAKIPAYTVSILERPQEQEGIYN